MRARKYPKIQAHRCWLVRRVANALAAVMLVLWRARAGTTREHTQPRFCAQRTPGCLSLPVVTRVDIPMRPCVRSLLGASAIGHRVLHRLPGVLFFVPNARVGVTLPLQLRGTGSLPLNWHHNNPGLKKSLAH